MTIILDFNRTLFDPETESLYSGVIDLLKNLSHTNNLYLVSRNEPGRKARFKELKIESYFKKIILVENKTKETLETLCKGVRNVVIVGDRVNDEILLGRQLGWTTVWVKQGEFAGEQPTRAEQPNHIIRDIRELENIIAEYE